MNDNLPTDTPDPDPAPDPIADLRELVDVLAAALALWALNDHDEAQPEVRHAGNTARDAIDAMLRVLYRMRSTLVDEMRVSDDATNARVDALLEKIRLGGQGDDDQGES